MKRLVCTDSGTTGGGRLSAPVGRYVSAGPAAGFGLDGPRRVKVRPAGRHRVRSIAPWMRIAIGRYMAHGRQFAVGDDRDAVISLKI